MIVWGDTETGSRCDLKSAGGYRYAEDPSTQIQLFSYALEDGPVKLWDPYSGERMPLDLREYILDPQYIWTFHNAQFDRLIIYHCLKINIPVERFRCSMAQAMSHALPGSLEKCGEILGIREDARKLKDGKKLMMLFCKPNPRTGFWANPKTHPEEWARYKEYCINDTAAMREITKKMPKWNYPSGRELDLWHLDQKINDRGMYIDLEMVNAAVRAIEEEKAILATRTRALTNDEVQAASQRDVMMRYLIENFGVELPDMRKATLEKLLDNEDLPDALRELLEVRLSTCTSSTAKYTRLLKATGEDSRLRGTIAFAGAGRTARDAGRIFQPQNLPRPTLKHEVIEPGIEALKAGIHKEFEYDTMQLCSSALRYAICAPEGKKLVVSDLSNIEGRVLAWLAGEEWKLEAFRKYDAGKGPDLYVAAYAKAFRVPHDTVDDAKRQVGKVMELAFGFRGGVGAFLAFAGKVDLNQLPKTVLPYVPADVIREATRFYDWMNDMDIDEAKAKAEKKGGQWEDYYEPKKTFGMEKAVFVAIDCLKRQWRREHKAIEKFWNDSEDALKNAVEVANVDFPFGRCIARRSGKWVRIILPSGRSIPYPGMEIGKDGKLVFKGVDQFTKKWGSIKTGGGKISENCTQALARDVFKHGELLADEDGFDIVLKVHDELVTEVDDIPEYNAPRLEELMATVPYWAPGLPLAAAGKESYRYHK